MRALSGESNIGSFVRVYARDLSFSRLNPDPTFFAVRLNIESVFQQFDSQLSAALAKAALETIPGMTTKGALRLYGTFRRNAITALSPWEPVPADMLSETGQSETGQSETGNRQESSSQVSGVSEPKPRG